MPSVTQKAPQLPNVGLSLTVAWALLNKGQYITLWSETFYV